jgi:hypothetical protein
MIRWVAVIFLALIVFYPLLPWLDKLRVGHLPGDLRFRLRGVVLCLPFGSTVVWSVLILSIAKLASWYCVFC